MSKATRQQQKALEREPFDNIRIYNDTVWEQLNGIADWKSYSTTQQYGSRYTQSPNVVCFIDGKTRRVLEIKVFRVPERGNHRWSVFMVQITSDWREPEWVVVFPMDRDGKSFYKPYLRHGWTGYYWVVWSANTSDSPRWVMKVFTKTPRDKNDIELRINATVSAEPDLDPFQQIESDDLHNGLQLQQGRKRVNDNEPNIGDDDEEGQQNLQLERSRKRARLAVSDATQNPLDLNMLAIEHRDDAADVASEGARTGHVLVEAAGAAQTVEEPADSGPSGNQEQDDTIILQPQLQNALEPVFRFISKRDNPGEPRRYPRHKFKTSMNLRVAAVVEGAATPKTPMLEVTINNGPPQPIDIESQEDLDDYVLKPIDALPMHEPKNVWIRGLELGEILA